MGNQTKRKSLSQYVVKQLLIYTITLVVVAGGYLLVINELFSSGIILPANHTEKEIIERYNELSTKKTITASDIPSNANYLIYQQQTGEKVGTIDVSYVNDVELVLENPEIKPSGKYYYMVIERGSERLVLQYQVRVVAKYALVNKIIPNIELFFIIFIVGIFILVVWLASRRIAQKINKQLLPIKQTTIQVLDENLSFTKGYAEIKEFEEVLQAIENLKKNLQLSLKKEWESEQQKQQQMAALAHDIKTPLTIIKGNVELLLDQALSEEDAQYAEFIKTSVEQMEMYTTLLLDVSRGVDNVQYQPKKELVAVFFTEIVRQGKIIVENNNCQFVVEKNVDNNYFIFDKVLLERAIINIISNAVTHSPEDKNIYFKYELMQETLVIEIIDEGHGFSAEDLAHAAEQFYMGDTSRHQKEHYGIGLYMAKLFVEMHQGTLSIENDIKTKGAKVIIVIPANNK